VEKKKEDAVQRMLLPRTFLISLFAGYLVTAAGLFVLALLLLQFQLSEKTVDIGIIAVYVLSAFMAGFLAGKQLQSRKFFWGMITGVLYYLLLLVVSVVIKKQLNAEPGELLTTLLICVGSGMLGGMLS
jgi:putative membrane protein (TIGR04086 family)